MKSTEPTGTLTGRSHDVLVVAHLFNQFCPRGAPFRYRLAANPHVKSLVLCNRRLNEDTFPHEYLCTPRFSNRIKNGVLARLSRSLATRLARPVSRWEWRRLVAKTQPDVFHIQFGDHAVRCLPLLARHPQPLIVTFHGSDINCATYSAAYCQKLRELFNRAAVCHFVSVDLRDQAVDLGCDPRKAKVVYLGTPIPNQHTDYTERTDDCEFACVASLTPSKGHEILLSAFRELRKSRPKASLHLYGDGPLGDRLRWVSNRLGLDDAVNFHGQVSNTDVQKALLKNTDVVILASHKDDAGCREGIPVSLMEACAAGVPCVSTRCGGIPELIQEDRTGLLVDERNEKQLTTTMLRLARDPKYREALGIAARDFVKQYFDLDRQLEIIAGLYCDAMLTVGRTQSE